MTERKPGFYWVKQYQQDRWEPAEWTKEPLEFKLFNGRGWFLLGAELPLYDKDLTEIGPEIRNWPS